MSKIALAFLILGILALFSYTVVSQPDVAPAEPTELRSEPPKTPGDAARPEQQSVNSAQAEKADLEQLSEDTKANSERLAALKSDLLRQLQDAKSSNDQAVQAAQAQINELRSEQAKLRAESKETNDKAIQGLRGEVAASQTKLVAQVDDALKGPSSRLDGAGQRIDALQKDLDELKKRLDEDRQNTPSVSPGLALIVALAALVLGPFVAYQFLANQLEGIKQQATGARTSPIATTDVEDNSSLSPSEPRQQDEVVHHEAPSLGEDSSAEHQDRKDQAPAHDQEQA
ncbi:hypothetical protein [Bradyrhizobium jicamae]|uniref:hypothetical protein n=1 Tax=Bradyrhizobium jicamae TaxID=280332 RepID=UPI001BA488A5|nr:hypothetical protein [Bradyrhizobium jicamae]MBR0934153.1 hypothetical protein [Bradyrhizobium jicamae]